MKNIKNLLLILGFLAILPSSARAQADAVIYEAHVPAVGNYTSFCDSSYHGLGYCELTGRFSFGEEQIVNAITMYDLGCNSMDEPEMLLSYALVNADTDEVAAEVAEGKTFGCTQDYPEGHSIPTTLSVPRTKLESHQDYYLILRASRNERARAYWGVDASNQASFQIHGTAAPKDPVILIPGIMGPSLRRSVDGKEIWPNANEMVLSAQDDHLDDLKLNTDGSQPAGKEAYAEAVIDSVSFSAFGQDLVTQNFYGSLIEQFTDRGYVLGKDLFAVAYDWRLDLKTQVSKLAAAVSSARAQNPGAKISLVAHSMGGLLVKQYLSDAGNALLIDKAVLIGVPQLGAPAMFKVLSYGDNLGFEFPVIQKDILNSAKIKEISQNMPGAYELLPSRAYVSVAGGYIKDFRNGRSGSLSYDESVAHMTSDAADARNSSLIAAAQDFHDNVDLANISGPTVYNLAACGDPSTIGEVRLYDGGKINIAGTEGDGTVPLESAMHDSIGHSRYFISSPTTGIDHGGLVRDGRVVSLIGSLVEGTSPAAFPGLGTTSEACQTGNKIFRFSTHSPVALHVYDSGGRHVGPTSDGNIELTIPGSVYTTLNGNSFAFVPANDEYRVEIDALAAGEFTLKAGVLEGPELVSSANYVDVPLADGDVTARAVFSEDNMAPELELDKDGDSVSDISVQPTAKLFDVAAADSEPPQIIFSGVPTGTIITDTAFVVDFSAFDQLSGVASVTASLDGAPFASGATLSSPLTGKRVIIIQAADNAGHPKLVTAEFEQSAAPANPPPAQPPSGSSGSGGSSGGSGGRSRRPSSASSGRAPGAATSTAQQASRTVTTGTIAKALPACLQVPAGALGRGRANDRAQVVLLQAFLNRELELNIPLTGFFGPITELAVRIFQLKNYADILAPAGLTSATGFVGRYTLAKMQAKACI